MMMVVCDYVVSSVADLPQVSKRWFSKHMSEVKIV